ARADVVVILGNDARVESCRQKLRVRILRRRLRDLLEVVTQAAVECERWAHLPLVLQKRRVLCHVGMRDRSGSSGAGKCLQIARGDSVLEIRKAAEAVRAEEVAREVVEDPIAIDVEAALD